jgi:uncharacterized membrane protein YtjA (UPF0391 family)
MGRSVRIWGIAGWRWAGWLRGLGSGGDARRQRGTAAACQPFPRAEQLEALMLNLLILLIVVALVAGALGFTGVAAGAATAAKFVFGLMVIGIIVVLILMAMGIALLV